MRSVISRERELSVSVDHSPPRGKVDYTLLNSITTSRITQLKELDQNSTTDLKLRQQLLEDIINCNMGIIIFIAQKYADKGDLEDLTSLGVVTLLESLPWFTPGRAKFSTYIYPRIRGTISRYVYENRTVIREPLSHHKKVKKSGQAFDTATYQVFSLSKDPKLQADGPANLGTDPLEDILPNKAVPPVEIEALKTVALSDLMTLAQEAGLDDQAQEVLYLRTVLSSQKSNIQPPSQADIGLLLDNPVTRQRVSQIEQDIKRQLCRPPYLQQLRQILSQGTEIDQYLP